MVARSQFFTILHRWGLVGWHVYKIDRSFFNNTNLVVREGETGFHNIIGYNYKNNPRGGNYPTVVEPLPLARGTFADSNFRRILSYADNTSQYRLPYIPETPQEGYDQGQKSL